MSGSLNVGLSLLGEDASEGDVGVLGRKLVGLAFPSIENKSDASFVSAVLKDLISSTQGFAPVALKFLTPSEDDDDGDDDVGGFFFGGEESSEGEDGEGDDNSSPKASDPGAANPADVSTNPLRELLALSMITVIFEVVPEEVMGAVDVAGILASKDSRHSIFGMIRHVASLSTDSQSPSVLTSMMVELISKVLEFVEGGAGEREELLTALCGRLEWAVREGKKVGVVSILALIKALAPAVVASAATTDEVPGVFVELLGHLRSGELKNSLRHFLVAEVLPSFISPTETNDSPKSLELYFESLIEMMVGQEDLMSDALGCFCLHAPLFFGSSTILPEINPVLLSTVHTALRNRSLSVLVGKRAEHVLSLLVEALGSRCGEGGSLSHHHTLGTATPLMYWQPSRSLEFSTAWETWLALYTATGEQQVHLVTNAFLSIRDLLPKMAGDGSGAIKSPCVPFPWIEVLFERCLRHDSPQVRVLAVDTLAALHPSVMFATGCYPGSPPSADPRAVALGEDVDPTKAVEGATSLSPSFLLRPVLSAAMRLIRGGDYAPGSIRSLLMQAFKYAPQEWAAEFFRVLTSVGMVYALEPQFVDAFFPVFHGLEPRGVFSGNPELLEVFLVYCRRVLRVPDTPAVPAALLATLSNQLPRGGDNASVSLGVLSSSLDAFPEAWVADDSQDKSRCLSKLLQSFSGESMAVVVSQLVAEAFPLSTPTSTTTDESAPWGGLLAVRKSHVGLARTVMVAGAACGWSSEQWVKVLRAAIEGASGVLSRTYVPASTRAASVAFLGDCAAFTVALIDFYGDGDHQELEAVAVGAGCVLGALQKVWRGPGGVGSIMKGFSADSGAVADLPTSLLDAFPSLVRITAGICGDAVELVESLAGAWVSVGRPHGWNGVSEVLEIGWDGSLAIESCLALVEAASQEPDSSHLAMATACLALEAARMPESSWCPNAKGIVVGWLSRQGILGAPAKCSVADRRIWRELTVEFSATKWNAVHRLLGSPSGSEGVPYPVVCELTNQAVEGVGNNRPPLISVLAKAVSVMVPRHLSEKERGEGEEVDLSVVFRGLIEPLDGGDNTQLRNYRRVLTEIFTSPSMVLSEVMSTVEVVPVGVITTPLGEVERRSAPYKPVNSALVDAVERFLELTQVVPGAVNLYACELARVLRGWLDVEEPTSSTSNVLVNPIAAHARILGLLSTQGVNVFIEDRFSRYGELLTAKDLVAAPHSFLSKEGFQLPTDPGVARAVVVSLAGSMDPSKPREVVAAHSMYCGAVDRSLEMEKFEPAWVKSGSKSSTASGADGFYTCQDSAYFLRLWSWSVAMAALPGFVGSCGVAPGVNKDTITAISRELVGHMLGRLQLADVATLLQHALVCCVISVPSIVRDVIFPVIEDYSHPHRGMSAVMASLYFMYVQAARLIGGGVGEILEGTSKWCDEGNLSGRSLAATEAFLELAAVGSAGGVHAGEQWSERLLELKETLFSGETLNRMSVATMPYFTPNSIPIRVTSYLLFHVVAPLLLGGVGGVNPGSREYVMAQLSMFVSHSNFNTLTRDGFHKPTVVAMDALSGIGWSTQTLMGSIFAKNLVSVFAPVAPPRALYRTRLLRAAHLIVHGSTTESKNKSLQYPSGIEGVFESLHTPHTRAEITETPEGIFVPAAPVCPTCFLKIPVCTCKGDATKSIARGYQPLWEILVEWLSDPWQSLVAAAIGGGITEAASGWVKATFVDSEATSEAPTATTTDSPSSEGPADAPQGIIIQRKVGSWDVSSVGIGSSSGRAAGDAGHSKLGSNLIVVASLVNKLPNLGGLMRTCEIMAAEKLVMPFPLSQMMKDGTFKAVCVGAYDWVDTECVGPEGLVEYLQGKKDEGYSLVGLEQSTRSVAIEDFKFPQKAVVILGDEVKGVPSEVLAMLSHCVEIPQYGRLRSLNVHVSGALLIQNYASTHLFPGSAHN